MDKLFDQPTVLPWQWFGNLFIPQRESQMQQSSGDTQEDNSPQTPWQKLLSYLKPYRDIAALFCFMTVCMGLPLASLLFTPSIKMTFETFSTQAKDDGLQQHDGATRQLKQQCYLPSWQISSVDLFNPPQMPQFLLHQQACMELLTAQKPTSSTKQVKQ